MKQERKPSWYLFVILRNRRFLLMSILAVMIPTVIVTYLLKKQYTVTTVIMPPESGTSLGLSLGGMGISDFAGYFSGGMGFSLPLMTTMSDVYVEMLNSRTLIDRVILSSAYIDSMDLRRQYDRNADVGMYWARKMFKKNFEAAVTPSGFIEIRMTTPDPLYSVAVSERIVAVLDSLNSAISTSRGHNSRLLVEERLRGADSLLAAASDSLQSFQLRWGVISPEEELTQLITTLAQLKQQYLELRASAAALGSSFGTGGTTAALEMERRASAVLGVIRQMETGDYSPSVDSVFSGLALREFPEAAYEYARLRSDYEMALQLSGVLRVSLQQALVDESMPTPSVRLLDAPAHPGWKSKPRKIFIWLEVFAVSLALLLTFVFARENIWSYQKGNPEGWAEWQKLFSDIRSDLPWRRRSRQPPDSSPSS